MIRGFPEPINEGGPGKAPRAPESANREKHADGARFCQSDYRGDEPLGSPLRLAAALFGPVVV